MKGGLRLSHSTVNFIRTAVNFLYVGSNTSICLNKPFSPNTFWHVRVGNNKTDDALIPCTCFYFRVLVLLARRLIFETHF